MSDDDANAVERIRSLDASATRHRTSAAGGAMVWREWGEGPDLVLLHGGSGSWTHWIRTIAPLARCHRVLAADLPGLGDSPSPAEPYDAVSLGTIVAAGIDALVAPDRGFDVVGFSFGGIVGAEVALLAGNRVRSLAVVGSPAFGIPPTGPSNDVLPVAPELAFAEALPLHRRNLATLMLADAGAIDALALRLHHDNLRRARLKSRKIARSDGLARALARVQCRLHGIWGERDVTVHPDLASLERLFLAAGAGNGFEVIEGAGHWVMYEAPDRFNALLARALRGEG